MRKFVNLRVLKQSYNRNYSKVIRFLSRQLLDLQHIDRLCYVNRMYLLILLLVPAAFVYYRFGAQKDDSFSVYISCIAGIAAGVLAVLVDSVLNAVFTDKIATFPVKLVYFFLVDSCVPYVLGNLLLFFLFKGSARERISRLRPQSFGIAAFYLPYIMSRFYNLPDIWPVLFVPAMTVAILFLIDSCIARYLARTRGTPDVVDFILVMVPVAIALLLADVSKAFWYFRFPFWVFLPVSLVVAVLPFALRVRKYAKA